MYGWLQKKRELSEKVLSDFIKFLYRASHIRLISEFILYATKNTNDADHLTQFIM
jgi:hypothetical protein